MKEIVLLLNIIIRPMEKPVKNNNIPPGSQRKTPPPEIRLPFEHRKKETGEWVYDHRVALSITVIAYLVLAIFFVSAKIIMETPKARSEIIIDFDDLDKLQKELEKAEELNRRLNEQSLDLGHSVRNVVSNENAQTDQERISRATEEILDRAQQVQSQSRETRQMYEQGLHEEQRMIQEQRNNRRGGEENRDVKVEGNVVVSFSLTNPLRTASDLFIPAYQCQGGGKVTVNVTVNQNGDVTNAVVDKRSSSSDYCMTSTAVAAAYRSRFNVNLQAPQKHTGTITYTFVPQ